MVFSEKTPGALRILLQRRTSCLNGTEGFSLIEGMVAIVILAILAQMAVSAGPTLGSEKLAQRAAHTLRNQLAHARMTAVARGRSVVACPGTPTSGCKASSDWSSGWLAFIDGNRDAAYQQDEELLIVGVLRPDLTVRWRAPYWIRFSAMGEVWPNGHFRICDQHSDKSTALIITLAGRTRISGRAPGDTAIQCEET